MAKTTTETKAKAKSIPPKAPKKAASKALDLALAKRVKTEKAAEKKRQQEQAAAELQEQRRLDAEDAREEQEQIEREEEEDDEDADDLEDPDDDDLKGDPNQLPLLSARSALENMTTLPHDDDDIFEVTGESWVKRMQPVYYEIYRNSEMLAKKDHPYTWDLLQKEYGKGVYTIRLKDYAEKRIRKAQTRSIAAIPGQEGYNGYTKVFDPSIPVANSPITAQEVLKLVSDAEARVRAELGARPAQDTAGNAVMQLLMQTMSQNQQATNAMMDRQAQATAQMFERMDRNSQQNTQLFQEQIKAIVNKPEKKELGLLEMMALMDKAKTEGLSQYKTIMDMVREQSEDKEDLAEKFAEILAKNKPEPGKDKSSLDVLIEGLAPALGAVLAAQAAKGQGGFMGTPGPDAQAVVAVPAGGAGGTGSPGFGGPAPAQPRNAAAPTVVGGTRNPNAPGAHGAQGASQKGPNPMKDKILSAITPMVAQGLMLRRPAVEIAQKACEALRDLHVSRLDVIANFKEADLIALRKEYKLPEQADPWLKEFYGHVTEAPQAPNRVDTKAASPEAPSAKPGAEPSPAKTTPVN